MRVTEIIDYAYGTILEHQIGEYLALIARGDETGAEQVRRDMNWPQVRDPEGDKNVLDRPSIDDLRSAHTEMTRRREALATATPVGIVEIAEMLGVQRPTVDQWQQRGILPQPRWTVGGRPAWSELDIHEWARQTGRLKQDNGSGT